MLPKTTKAVQSPRKLFDRQHFELRAYFSWKEEGGSIPHIVMYVHNLKKHSYMQLNFVAHSILPHAGNKMNFDVMR